MTLARRRLFATDLDGTLLDRDGRIHPSDALAIRSAKDRGVVVTIATGRLTSGTFFIARTLGLDAPIVCADGSVLVCPSTERILERRSIPISDVEAILHQLSRNALASFVFTHDAIHSCERGRAHQDYVRGWSPSITTHPDVLLAEPWKADPEAVVMLVGMGAPDGIDTLRRFIQEASPSLEVLSFTSSHGGPHVFRVVARGVSKGTALASLARRLDIDRSDVAVIGDWLNDVPMFEWAGRSFAMPHAPSGVREVATDWLDEEACKFGAIAESMRRWLTTDTEARSEKRPLA